MSSRSQAQSAPVATRPRLGSWTFWLLTAALLLFTAARLTEAFAVPWPRCGLRTLTGIPCPLCGTTRCLIAWSHGDLAAAFAFNPLISATVLGAAIWLCLQGLGLWRRSHCSLWPGLNFRPRSWRVLAAALVVANWIYLLLKLPP